ARVETTSTRFTRSGDSPEASSQTTAVIEISLSGDPAQITVDPDRILLDSNPANNNWIPELRCRLTPLYTQLDDADLANAYDRWNLTVGPWVWFSAFNDPWYTRSPLAGVRAGVVRTQEFMGGVFAAYRTNDRNLIAGVDGVWDHFPLPHTQV